ncbi:glycosyl transferase, UDP-glucuronosyltransferase [Rivularia sp. PCC 7116]|uniref:glycosyltransferase n=1 Tax=Rivularia sp. PCC 7116 TaxID=373994 RepID=UPI00029F4A61|nr:glycosyltransferase [Rivularia sp. PCC 7116]AFY57474.1 glycosyl transferase, UDP-glucuronosyltransferase [Rivularia sp. PCC 7116]
MNIFIVTVGSRGDVQPYVALGKGLKEAGHDVTICTCSSFESLITEHGLPYGYMNDDFIKLVDSEAGREAIESGGNFLSLIKTMLKLLKESKALTIEMLKDSWNAAQVAKPDIVIFHPKAMAGSHIAEKLGVPAVMAVPVPLIVPTAEYVAIGFPNLKLGGWYNKFSYVLLHKGYRVYDDVINEFRQNVLGIDKISKSISPIQMADGKPIPVLYGYSELVSQRPKDWTNTTHITGYWFLEQKDDWQPPTELIDFLEAGEQPVYIGFGSMAGRNPQRIANIVVDALQKAKKRGIIATGWGGLDAENLPETIFKVDKVPHNWLFPRVSAVVHHGGAGTIAAGLRAGKPTIVCPFLVDQFYWGERVYALGVGSKPISQKKLTVDKLAEAILEVTTDRVIRQNAETLGKKIREEDGIRNAIAIIENLALLN